MELILAHGVLSNILAQFYYQPPYNWICCWNSDFTMHVQFMGYKGGSQEGGVASAVWQPMTALKNNHIF